MRPLLQPLLQFHALRDVAKNPRDKLSLLSRPGAKGKLHWKFSAAFFPAHQVYYFSDNVRFALGA